jgi:hypothetical protein
MFYSKSKIGAGEKYFLEGGEIMRISKEELRNSCRAIRAPGGEKAKNSVEETLESSGYKLVPASAHMLNIYILQDLKSHGGCVALHRVI